jgi:hypothetical protein
MRTEAASLSQVGCYTKQSPCPDAATLHRGIRQAGERAL